MAEPPSAAALASTPPSALRRGVVAELRGAAGSLTFLTRLPIGSVLTIDGEDLARSAPYFPLVGAGVGAVVGRVVVGLAAVANPLLAAVVGVTVLAALTGALHLDAIADTFDALGTRSREAALRTMREPTIGAFGATALVLDLFLWTALFATLAGRPSFVAVVVVVGAWARVGPVLLLTALPYARPDGGVGSALSRGSRPRAAVAVAVALAIGVVLLGLPAAALVATMMLALAGLGVGFRRWLGGVTGDALGCSVEVLGVVGLSAAAGLAIAGVLP